MAVTAIGRAASAGPPNASAFLDLYQHERPHPAKPVDEFLDELKDLVRAHPIDGRLAEALKYGSAPRPAMQRWIKDYYQYIRLDAQGTAATIARCPRRWLYLALSPSGVSPVRALVGRTVARMARWLSITPLGRPVVPEV